MDHYLAQVCKRWREVAFQLNGGDSLSGMSKCTGMASPARDGQARQRLWEGYRVFLDDPMRVAALRTLRLNASGSPHNVQVVQFLTDVLGRVNIPNLRNLNFDLDPGTPDSPPLLNTLMETLQSAPLKELRLSYTTAWQRPPISQHTPLHGTHKTLGSLTLSAELVMTNLPTATPNLQQLKIFHVPAHMPTATPWTYPFKNLKSTMLTSLDLGNVDLETTFRTLPPTTAANLTFFSFRMYGTTSPSDSHIRFVAKLLTRMLKLKDLSFHIQKSGITVPQLHLLLNRVRAPISVLRITVICKEGQEGMLIDALKSVNSLEKVNLNLVGYEERWDGTRDDEEEKMETAKLQERLAVAGMQTVKEGTSTGRRLYDWKGVIAEPGRVDVEVKSCLSDW
ncbi:hypothetical protein HDV00_006709 [Rhizophlyctis rosea]|nr:hypothetical protein HDV00_006709 [Rhizophlyctis rosea]